MREAQQQDNYSKCVLSTLRLSIKSAFPFRTVFHLGHSMIRIVVNGHIGMFHEGERGIC